MADATDPDVYHLSDGSTLELPAGTPDLDAKRFVDQNEAKLAQYYSAQAEKQNSPVFPVKPDGSPGDKIYSASTTYPNTYMGAAMAHLDHIVPGANWANKNVVQSGPGNVVNAVMGPLGRAESNAVSWPVDFPGTIYNTAKHYTPLGTAYDAPSLSGAIRGEVGAPELGPDAPYWQRAGEGALSSVMSPAVGAENTAGVFSSLVGSGVGTALSDWGGRVAGEGGSLLGSIIGAMTGNVASKGAAKIAAPSLRDPSAEEVGQAVAQSRPTPADPGYTPGIVGRFLNRPARPATPGSNFQGLNTPALGNRDWSGFTPGFISLANPTGQRIAGALRSIPWSGKPIEEGATDTADYIQAARDAAANELGGPRGIPPNAGPSTIGSVLTEGAQDAITQLYRAQNAAWNAQRARMSAPDGPPGSAEVPLPNTVNTARSEVANERRGDVETAATHDIANQILNVSPGLGPNTSRFGANQPPLPALPSMPWSRVDDMLHGIRQALENETGLPSDIADTLKTVANQEREAAAEAAAPGYGGAQFRQLNESYAKYIADKEQLAKFAGKNLGGTGGFERGSVPGEETAANLVTSRMQSPSDPVMEALQLPEFAAEARRNVAGQIASGFGNVGKKGTVGGGFRPEQFVNDLAANRPGLEALATGPGGQPSAAMGTLENAAKIAQNFSPKTSRTGLQQTLGASGVVAKALEGHARALEWLSGWKGSGYVGVPLLARAYATALESDPLKRAMMQQPQNWADLASAIPTIAAVNQVSPPAAHRGTVTVSRP